MNRVFDVDNRERNSVKVLHPYRIHARTRMGN